MKSSFLLILTVLCCCCCCLLRAQTHGFHEDFAIYACSSSDGEVMWGLDGEELWYADFTRKEGVQPQPEFVNPHMSFPGTYESAVINLEICRKNLDVEQTAFKDLKLEFDPPSSPVIYSRDDVELGVKNQLICHVTGFYPAPVTLYWTKNQENVTEGFRLNVPFPNQDGTFQQFSSLSFVPQLGDIYSCSVEHGALTQPLTRLWDVEKTQPGLGPSIFCGVGLTVGLLGVAIGTFFLIKGNECS